jgi:hypothetical protein
MMNKMLRIIQRRRGAYKVLFGIDNKGELSIAGKIVMADLAKFCRANQTVAQIAANGNIDPIATGIAEGRRQVFLRIAQFVHLSDADLVRLMDDNGTES